MEHDRKQEERLDYLLDAFKKDSGRYGNLETGDGYEDRRMALRSLMNIRMPGRMADEVLKVQDEFLTEEAQEKGVVPWMDIPTVREQYGSIHPFGDRISVWQGDITRLAVDAIVNAANAQMLGCFIPCHKCIDNAIHSAAGIRLREECASKMHQKCIRYGRYYEEPTGLAMLTKGYNLPAGHVIHTVGPVVAGELNDSLRQDLKNCYRNVLECARLNGLRTVAFCCVSTGEFRFPNKEAAEIAVETVTDYLRAHGQQFERIIFNVFKDLDLELYEKIFR